MIERRKFLKASICGGVSSITLPALTSKSVHAAEDSVYRLSRHIPTRMYDGKKCWCHSRAGIVPGAGRNGLPRVVMTMNTLNVSGGK
jgi:hypothetical protein